MSEYSHTKQSRDVATFYPPPVADKVTSWTIRTFSAADEPERWRKHTQSADESYASRGLQAIAHDQQAASHKSPTFFPEAMLDGVTIGGVRMHLRNSAGRLPIQDELEGHVDTSRLEDFIQELASEGVVHCGGLWIDPAQKGTGLAGDLGRSYMPMIVAAKARYYIAMSHQYILNAWCSLGWQSVPEFPVFPYPDERYQTCVILGDVNRWPRDLAYWAHNQAGTASLGGPGNRFTIQPMRVEGSPLVDGTTS